MNKMYFYSIFFRIDGSADSGVSLYMRHVDADPSCAPRVVRVKGIPYVAFFALKDIGVGRELTYDHEEEKSLTKDSTEASTSTNAVNVDSTTVEVTEADDLEIEDSVTLDVTDSTIEIAEADNLKIEESVTLDVTDSAIIHYTLSVDVKKRRAPSRRPCPYCGEPQAKLKRHLILKQSDKPEVKLGTAAPKTEQKCVFERLRREGMVKANMGSLGEASRVLQVEKRGVQERAFCSKCSGLYSSKSFYALKCFSSSPFKKIKLATFLSSKCDSAKQLLKQEVRDKFQNNAIGKVCKEDPIGIEL